MATTKPTSGPVKKLKRLAALMTERQTWEPRWRDLVKNLLPYRGRFVPDERNKGNRKDQDIIDNTGTLALNVATSSLYASVTSPARSWFRLDFRSPEFKEHHEGRIWLDEVQRIMGDVLGKSNFYHVAPLLYTDLAGFGTSAIFAKEDPRDIVRFEHFPLGTFYIQNGPRGSVEVCYRIKSMTTEQLVEEFGLEQCSSKVQDQYKNDNLDAWHEVVWCVERNPQRNPRALGAERMAYSSCYFERSGHGDKYLRESGFEEFPVMAPRWETTGEDAYGTGLGSQVLGDLKELQALNKQRSMAVALAVKPPLKGPASLAGTTVDLLPGGLTLFNGEETGGLTRVYETNLGLAEVLENIHDVQGRVDRGLHKDLFLMFAGTDRREITATEIHAREQEKVLVLGKPMQALDQEFLDPLIDRVYGMCWRAGLFPPPPEDIASAEIRVEYTNVMAQAMRASGIGAITSLLQLAGQMAQFDQEVVDVVDTETALRETAIMLGSPEKILRSRDAVSARKQARADAAQKQQQVEQAEMASKAARNLSQADTTGQNALTDLTNSGAV